MNNIEINKNNGFIVIYRSLKSHWIWSDPIKLRWWLDLLLSANYSFQKVNIGFELFDCGRGQTVKTLNTWSKEWLVDKSSVRHFLKLLQKDNMIVIENLTKCTRITICNYDSYQTLLNDKQTQNKRKANAKQTQDNLNNKENKDNKENKENEEVVKVSQKETLTSQLKPIFDDFYKNEIKCAFTWSAKEMKNLENISKKIMFQIKEKNLPETDDQCCESFKVFLENINDNWVLSHLSPSIINSQFNEILSSIKNQNNGKSKGATTEQLAEMVYEKFAKKQ